MNEEIRKKELQERLRIIREKDRKFKTEKEKKQREHEEELF